MSLEFTCSVTINKPIGEVVQKFDSFENLKHWQDGYVSHEHLSGVEGEVGAKTRMVYKMGNREMELIETITVRNLPEEFSGTYEHIHMNNNMTASFKELDANTTQLNFEVEYTEFKSFMPKMMALLFPGMFKKQTQKWLDQFRDFTETGKSIIS